MTRQQVLNKLEAAWVDFHQSYAGLTPAQMVQPGVMDNWSVKDLIAHVGWWEEETLKHLPGVLNKIRPPKYSDLYGGLDAFNALMTQKWQPLSMEQIHRKVDQTHAELVAYLRDIPEEQFSSKTRFYHRLRVDTFGHYPFHTQAIRDWRKKLSE